MLDLSSLNNEQRQAVEALEGPVCVLAGAGSGKTKALTMRIANLLEHGVNPSQILAITFTNKAAREMNERVAKLLNNPMVSDALTISTFHSFCVKLIRWNIKNCQYLSEGFSIVDSDDMKALCKNAILSLNLDPAKFKPGTAMGYISDKKNHLVWYDQYDEEPNQRVWQVIYKMYQEQLIKFNRCDFDDLLFYTYLMFRDNPGMVDKLQDRYRYVLIDEYQDTNEAQYSLVKLLTSKYRNLFVVGDVDQAIYGFRGSDYTNILNFNKDYPEAKTILLEKNYRSTASVLEAANAVIENNKKRVPKKLIATTNERFPIVSFEAADERQEASWLYYKIMELVGRGPYNYKDIAILVRNNMLTKPLEDIFIVKGTPYHVVGARAFYDRAEIKDSVAYLKFAQNPKDMLSMQRVINKPKRGIGEKSVLAISNYCTNNDLGFVEAVEQLEAQNALSSIVTSAKGKAGLVALKDAIKNFRRSLKTPNSKQNPLTNKIHQYFYDVGLFEMYNPNNASPEDEEIYKNKLGNIQNFNMMAEEYRPDEENKTLENFLDHVSLMSDADTHKENENKVTIMTCHASKGLEFPVVFIVAFEESVFPSWQAVNAEAFTGSTFPIEEERRLAYVAFTRAKKQLFISYAQKRRSGYKESYNDPSRFYNEIPYQLLEEE